MNQEKLNSILNSHKAWLDGRDGEIANLAYANLSGFCLTNADLFGVQLTGANLSNADLSGADLSNTDMIGAYLNNANLSGADMTEADLTGATLAEANLTNANLTDTVLTGAKLTDACLEGAYFNGQKIIQIWRRATRSDGYEFFLCKCKEGFFIKAGCRFLTLTKARKHWRKTRGGTPIGDETMEILRFFATAIKKANT